MVAAIPHLKRYARNLTHDRDRGADLVQDTLERGLRYRARFTEGTNVAAWLTTIMHHRFCELYRVSRSRKRFEVSDVDGLLAARAAVVDDPLIKMQAAEVFNAVGALRPIWRAPVLARLDGASQDEIATEFSISPGTVRSRICRARAKLREFA